MRAILPKTGIKINDYMREEEKRILKEHERRLKELREDIGKFQIKYADERRALEASYGTGNIPAKEENKLIKYAQEQNKKFNERQDAEKARYIKEIEDYDRRRNPSLIKEEPKKEAAPEKTTDGVPKSPFYSKFIGDYKPEPSKEPSPPAKGKDEERER